MCWMNPDDYPPDGPKLPDPAAAVEALRKAEDNRRRVYADVLAGGTMPGLAIEHAEARLTRATSEVQRCRIEVDQAYIAQAEGVACLTRPTATDVSAALRTKLARNRSIRQAEMHAARQPAVASPASAA